MRRSSLIGIALGALLVAVPGVSLALTVDLQLESVTVEQPGHEVVLSGTVTCDAGATVDIGFAVTQGPAFVQGSHSLTCTGAEQTWEIRTPIAEPRVHPGPATLDFGFSATLGDESIASGRSIEVFVAPGGAPWLFTMEEPA